MSNETTSVVLSICGIAAVVGVLIVLAAFLLLRVLKFSIFGIAVNALRILTEPKEETTALDVRAQTARPVTRDLRSQAKSIDFDAAVARQRQETNQSVQPSAYSAQSAAPGQTIQPPTQATVTYPTQPVAPLQPIQPTTAYTPPSAPVQPTSPSPFPPPTTAPAPGFNAPLRRPRKRRPISEGDEPDEGLLGGMLDGDDIL